MHFILTLLIALNIALPIEKLPDTISLKFERKVVQNKTTEIVNGVAYYQAPHRVFLEVSHPLKQIMLVEKNVLTIYYPTEKKAFRINSKGPIPMPFIQAILSAMKDDYGLSEMGYMLEKHEKRGNMLCTFWEPPKTQKKRMGKFILGTEKGLLTYAEALDPKGKTVIKSIYKKHVEFNGRHFPLESISEINNGSDFSKEFVTYSDVKFNNALPDEAVNFKIPDNITISEIEW